MIVLGRGRNVCGWSGVEEGQGRVHKGRETDPEERRICSNDEMFCM